MAFPPCQFELKLFRGFNWDTLLSSDNFWLVSPIRRLIQERAAHLFEIRNHLPSKQVNRIHDPPVRQVAHLHEAKYLVHAGLLVLL